MSKMDTKEKFSNCFVCSPTNPIGLHLVNKPVNGRSHMEIVPNENMVGLNGLMHGGFSSMLMDEVMYYACEAYGVDTVTLNMKCDFLNPAVAGHKLIAEGWVTKQERKKFFVEAELKDADDDNKVLVKAEGLYYEMDLSVFLPDEDE